MDTLYVMAAAGRWR